MRYADLIVVDGVVHTMDPVAPRADAVAVVGGRIAAVGDDRVVQDWRGPATRMVDARGRAVLPGLTDSHTHFHRASMLEAEYINFAALDPVKLQEVLDAVREVGATRGPDQWVQGDSLDALRLHERRYPTRYELDEACRDSPVVVRGIGRHVVAANSLALRLAGIDRSTPDPDGGRIERDQDGEPTGVLHERGKLRLDATQADTVVPALDESTRLAALRAGFARLQQFGVTTIHDIMREPREISDYILMRTSGELGARIRFYPRVIEAQTHLDHVLGLGMRSGFGDDMLRLAGMKLSVDGSLTVGNAALYDPYPGSDDNRGIIRIGPELLTRSIAAGHAAGLQVAVHAIGQRALDIALDAFENAVGEGHADRRHRIEHGYMPPRPGQLERMARLGLVLSTQPSMVYSELDSWIRLLGRDRIDGAMPMASAVNAGLHVQINSDYPCSPLDPFVGIRAAVERRSRDGEEIGPGEAVSVGQALAMMTTAPAWTVHEEGRAGVLRAGAFADLIVLDRDPFAVPSGELDQIRVDMTVLDGDAVFEV